MKAFSSAEPISARAIAISSIQGTFKEHVLFKLKQENPITQTRILNRGLSSFLKWGGKKYCGGHNLLPLVEIGLTVLPKSGGAIAPPAPPLLRPLYVFQ